MVVYVCAGLYTEGDANMVVSRGIGNSIIPIRFNNRPEIVVIEFMGMWESRIITGAINE